MMLRCSGFGSAFGSWMTCTQVSLPTTGPCRCQPSRIQGIWVCKKLPATAILVSLKVRELHAGQALGTLLSVKTTGVLTKTLAAFGSSVVSGQMKGPTASAKVSWTFWAFRLYLESVWWPLSFAWFRTLDSLTISQKMTTFYPVIRFEGSFIRYYFCIYVPTILSKFFECFQELKKADLESHLVRWALNRCTKGDHHPDGMSCHWLDWTPCSTNRGPIIRYYKKMMAMCGLLRPPECFIRIELLSLEPLKSHEPFSDWHHLMDSEDVKERFNHPPRHQRNSQNLYTLGPNTSRIANDCLHFMISWKFQMLLPCVQVSMCLCSWEPMKYTVQSQYLEGLLTRISISLQTRRASPP